MSVSLDVALLSECILPHHLETNRSCFDIAAELHDGQPGWGPDFNPGMPVAEFVTAALAGFANRQETVAVGHAKQVFDEFEEAKGKRVGPTWENVRKAMGKTHLFE